MQRRAQPPGLNRGEVRDQAGGWSTDLLERQDDPRLGVVVVVADRHRPGQSRRVVGAWRHLVAVATAPDRGTSDPAVLARLTRVPRVLWVLSFALVCAWSTWVVAQTVWAAST